MPPKTHHAMPEDLDLPESRGEAKADRRGMIAEIIRIIFSMEKWSYKRTIIFLSLVIVGLLGGAVGFQQRQITDVRAEYAVLREKQSDTILAAVHTTSAAVDRNTDAMREQSQTNREQAQTNREVREVLIQMLSKK